MFIAALCAQTLMFLTSGFSKLLTPADEVGFLSSRLHEIGIPLADWACKAGVAMVGVMQIACSLTIGAAGFYPRASGWGSAAAYGLAAFTLLVTLLFYPPGEKWIPFASNLSVFGGLLVTGHVMRCLAGAVKK